MIKIFLDSSDISEIRALKDKVDGFTTNPTLMRKAGVTDYKKFCKEVLREIGNKPISFEVFADDLEEIDVQVRKINQWGNNIYIKIPITTTNGIPTVGLIAQLQRESFKINVTAVFTPEQIRTLANNLNPNAQTIISVFAGRIADTGQDPTKYVWLAKQYFPNNEVLWASPREVLNIYQAEQSGANIITCTSDLIKKYEKMKGYNLNQLSLDTVKMFYDDAQASGFKL